MTSLYYDEAEIERRVSAGDHRSVVGGFFDEVGRLQVETLKRFGLHESHRLIDIGCGSLRGGIKIVEFLQPGHYFGIDLNRSLLDAGYEQEIVPLGLDAKLDRYQLKTDSEFDFEQFGETFDRALAFSLFTHLPFNDIRLCLENLTKVTSAGSQLHATFFETTEPLNTGAALKQLDGVVTFGHKDPFHYSSQQIEQLIDGLPWRADRIGEFGHPRGQKLWNFTRIDAVEKKTRELNEEERQALSLGAGENHYRAFVGPPDRFDLMSSSQFALLFQLGLRETHRVLDFGCGSLRLGRLLIPYLLPERYFGIEPNPWLIDQGFGYELGDDAQQLKRPSFSKNDDFDCDVFGQKFDFIVAQSIITHCGPISTRALFSSARRCLDKNGLFLFSYIKDTQPSVLPDEGWVYPGCVTYGVDALAELLEEADLRHVPIPWFHPGAQWHIAATSDAALPNQVDLEKLNGAVVR